jgi:hypothetical protein
MAIIGYLSSYLGRKTVLFFERWYIDFSRTYWLWVLEQFQNLDRSFALRINVHFWLQPLFGDYTTVGRIIGPVLRTGRIILGFLTYLLLFGAAILFWCFWILAIPFLIFKIILP